jgi:hypothetical protein
MLRTSFNLSLKLKGRRELGALTPMEFTHALSQKHKGGYHTRTAADRNGVPARFREDDVLVHQRRAPRLVLIRVDLADGPQIGDYFMMAIVFQTSTALESRLRQLALRMSSSCSSGRGRDYVPSLGFQAAIGQRVNATNPTQ